MKTITTSIFVQAKSKKEMRLLEREEMEHKVRNRAKPIINELGMGALDDLNADGSLR